MIPVATSSGEALEERVGDPGEHAELGDQLLYFAIVLLVAVAVLVALQWRLDRARAGSQAHDAGGTITAQDRQRTMSRSLTAVAVVSAIAALACGVQVYRVGDSGARAAWGDAVASSGTR